MQSYESASVVLYYSSSVSFSTVVLDQVISVYTAFIMLSLLGPQMPLLIWRMQVGKLGISHNFQHEIFTEALFCCKGSLFEV